MNAVLELPLETASPSLNQTDFVDHIIDVFQDKMLSDYRVNRFFNNRTASEQSLPLKNLVKAALSARRDTDWSELLDAYFMANFARGNSKPSLVTGNDFMFLLDVIGGEEPMKPEPLCDNHSFLLKLLPNDSHYDVALEHLAATLRETNASSALSQQLTQLATKARKGLLGRGRN